MTDDIIRETRGIRYRQVFIEAVRRPGYEPDTARWNVYIGLSDALNPRFVRETPLREIEALLYTVEAGDCRPFTHLRRCCEQSHDNPQDRWQEDAWWYRVGDDFLHSWDEGCQYDWDDMFFEGKRMVDALYAAGVIIDPE
jgi:hypothetical protein